VPTVKPKEHEFISDKLTKSFSDLSGGETSSITTKVKATSEKVSGKKSKEEEEKKKKKNV